MITSYGETSGFSVVSTDELLLVNGGKGNNNNNNNNNNTTVATTTTTTTSKKKNLVELPTYKADTPSDGITANKIFSIGSFDVPKGLTIKDGPMTINVNAGYKDKFQVSGVLTFTF